MKKKIFLGGLLSCGVHNEKFMIDLLVSNSDDFEITDSVEEADMVIIIDTCVSTYDNILSCINYVDRVLKTKKKSAKVIVSGCLTMKGNFELSERYEKVLNQVDLVSSDKIIEYILKFIKYGLDDDLLEDIKFPFSIFSRGRGVSVSPVTGCLNRCSFCKSNYIDFSLKSNSYEELERMAKDIDRLSEYGKPLNYIDIHSSNLSLYGVDLYGKQRCHEAINILTRSESIKFASVGALINWYPELVNEIINNTKIKTVFTSIESGSEKIYNLMNRPIGLDKLKEIIKLIKKNRPDIIIETELICGFPTETIDDLNRSIDIIYELDVNPIFLHPYCDSYCIPSSKLPQHSFEYCVESALYAGDKLERLKNKFDDIIKNSEMLVLYKDSKDKVYVVMTIDGNVKNISFNQFDMEYNTGDLIPANVVRCKQLAKRVRNRV